jgi:hypothetical protein
MQSALASTGRGRGVGSCLLLPLLHDLRLVSSAPRRGLAEICTYTPYVLNTHNTLINTLSAITCDDEPSHVNAQLLFTTRQDP